MNEGRTGVTEEQDADDLVFIGGSIIGTFAVGAEAGSGEEEATRPGEKAGPVSDGRWKMSL